MADTPRNPLMAVVLMLTFVIGLIAAIVVITTPLTPAAQALFGLTAAVGIYFLGRSSSRLVLTVLTVLSFIFVSRYIWWRATETLEFTDGLAAFLGYGLFLAELYLWIALVVTYVQSAWPLGRKPVQLPEDTTLWPTVDIFIPTFNEDLEIVSKTVLAAKALEYPSEKLKVYILDDGSRPEFRDFARRVGVGYIIRDGNEYAKAGNLNNAMKETNGDLVAVFDCDHIPTRWFLQLTAGWFIKEPRMAFIQTPHHFYNLDPFLRNLSAGDKVPPEGLLFYGLVQDGNDFWNACFFCGSCALLRRTAIEEVGGFATETVTEDAETALKMHRRGWVSGFIRVPMAAGLATETLGRFIQQRIRWARGMVQILRIDNPLLGPGLTLPQRLCYLSAMMHFLFPLPRFVLLTAPLAYLILDVRIITATAEEVFFNALPYLLVVIYVNWRIQGRYRHQFWSDVYETSLTLHLLWPTVKTFLLPRGGTFNVTSKGEIGDEDYFDSRLMVWHMALAGILLLGIGLGLYSVTTGQVIDDEIGTTFLNLFWAFISLLYVLASLATAREVAHTKEHRIRAQMPAVVRLSDGRTAAGATADLTAADIRIEVPKPHGVIGDRIYVEVDAANDRITVPAEVVEWEDDVMVARFAPQTLEEESDLVRLVFGRGDAWVDWDNTTFATPIQSAGEIVGSIGSFLRWSGGRAGRGSSRPGVKGPASRKQSDAERRSPKEMLENAMKNAARQTQIWMITCALGLAAVTGFGMADQAYAQEERRPVLLDRPGEENADAEEDDEASGEGEDAPADAEAAQTDPAATDEPAAPEPFFQPGQIDFSTISDAESGTLEEQPATGAFPANAAALGLEAAGRGGTRLITLTLRDLGAEPSIELRHGSLRGIPFSVRGDEVVTEALLSLNLTFSPSLLSGKSHVVVLLNGEGVGTIELDPSYGTTRTVNLPIDPFLIQTNNELLFEFIGEGTSGNPECPSEIDTSVWARIGHMSKIVLSASRFRVRNDLALLPAPFFDPSGPTRLVLPVVLPDSPPLEMLRAASITASYWGAQADYRGALFPVYLNTLPTENAVVFVKPNAIPAGVDAPAISGPTLAVTDNPNAAGSKLLLIMGRTDTELVHAAQALATGNLALTGPVAPVSQPTLRERQPYDAERWLPQSEPVTLGSYVEQDQLEGRGMSPGIITFPFRFSPDIFLWGRTGVPLTVRYRYPSGKWIDHEQSRLDVLINDSYIASLPLESSRPTEVAEQVLLADYTQNQGTVEIPPYLIVGQNRLQFFYDLQQVNQGECAAVIPNEIRTGIDVTTQLDMRNIYRLAKMPNLAFFAQAGFPYTRHADLSQTAFIMPNRIEAEDVEALLAISGLFGARTGDPAHRVSVISPQEANAAADKDLILLGSWDTQPLLSEWSDALPFKRQDNVVIVPSAQEVEPGMPATIRSWFSGREEQDTVGIQAAALKAGLVSFKSPLAEDRTVLTLLSGQGEAVDGVLNALTAPELTAQIQGDLVTVESDTVTSYRVARAYEIGDLPFWIWARWYVSDKPIGMIVLAVLAGFLIGFPMFTWLRSSASRKGADT